MLELVDKPRRPEELPSNSTYLWKVYLPLLESKDQKEKGGHYSAITAAANMILRELSLLPAEQFNDLFYSLFTGGLSSKALVVNVYQKMYRDLISRESFDTLQRDKFTPELLEMECKELDPMSWLSSHSELYKQEESLKNIISRYKNCLKSIHLTIDRVKDLPQFKQELEKLRNEGWLDWQILMALYNNLNNLKAHNSLRQNGKMYRTEEEWIMDFDKTFHKIRSSDEKLTYVEVPINEIIGKNLELQLQQLSIQVLGSFALSNNSRYPNQSAVRDFLISRFNFGVDDDVSLSPFVPENI